MGDDHFFVELEVQTAHALLAEVLDGKRKVKVRNAGNKLRRYLLTAADLNTDAVPQLPDRVTLSAASALRPPKKLRIT